MATRLTPPQWTIPRPAVARRLDIALARRITLLVAPTGGGKSVALREWAALARGVVVALPADPSRVIGAILEAVAGAVGPDPVPSPPKGGSCTVEEARELGVALGRGTVLAHHVPLVLDDADVLAGSPPARALVEALSEAAPVRLHLVVASRRPLGLSVAHLRPDDIGRIGPEALLVDHAEVATWLATRMGEDATRLNERVHQRSAGWPALVHAAIDEVAADDATAADSTGRAAGRSTMTAADGRPDGAPARRLARLARAQLESLEPGPRELLRRARHLPVLRKDLLSALDGTQADLDALSGHPALVSAGPRGLRLTAVAHDLLDADAAAAEPEAPAGAVVEAAVARYLDTDDIDLALLALRSGYDEALAVRVLVGEREALDDHPALVTEIIGGLDPRTRERADLRVILGAALHRMGRWDEAQPLLDGLRGTAEWTATTCHLLGFIAHYRGDLHDAVAVLEEGWAMAEPAVGAVQCGALAASAHWLLGDRDSCSATIGPARARAVALGDDVALAAVHTVVAMLAAVDGDRRANRAHYLRALDHAGRAGHAAHQIRILTNLGSHHLEEGRWDEALTHLDRAKDVAEANDHRWFLPMTRSNRAHVLLHLGRLEEAADEARRSIQLWERLGSAFATYPVPNLARSFALRGDRGTAERLLRSVMTETERSRETQASVPAAAELAGLLAADDVAEARKVLGWARDRTTGMSTAAVEIAAAKVAMRAGDSEEAGEALRGAAAAAARRGDGPAAAEVLTLRARLEDDPEVAAEAQEAWRALRHPIGEARALLELARMSPRSRAHALCEQAGHTLHALGCRAFDADLAAAAPDGPTVSAVAVRSLGRFQLLINGNAVDRSAWQSRKARDLLKILVAHRGRPVARSSLVRWLWPQDAAAKPDTVRRRLQVQLSTLRSVLDPERQQDVDAYVVSSDGAVSLNLTAVDVDVVRVLELVDRAERLAARGQHDAAVRCWEDAEAANVGEFLADDMDAEWAEGTRGQARQARRTTLMALAADAADDGRSNTAVRLLLLALELDPHDEPASLELVRVLTAAGRHGDARRRYEDYRRRMAELGVPPAPAPYDRDVPPN